MEEVKPRNHEANGPEDRGEGSSSLKEKEKGRGGEASCVFYQRHLYPPETGCENIKCIFSPEVESYRDKTYLSKEPSEFLFAELQLVLLAPESTVQVHWQVMVRAAAQHHRHSVHVLGRLNTQKCSCWSIPQLSLLPLMEPIIGVNFAHFLPYGSGQFNSGNRLLGTFGSATLDGVSDYYSQLIYKRELACLS
ncbi:hypothetical protein QTO34_004866 [Cnephaeus nilssonii]|uniref:Uncharacterized protein n=1 Tax=Cnephaeus nilssonii TaxID=3371016 RepID=A0AA40LIZ4_CNENI|nr:hypothetical protein QTO34_004866 [Eptesicus nilssonii]